MKGNYWKQAFQVFNDMLPANLLKQNKHTWQQFGKDFIEYINVMRIRFIIQNKKVLSSATSLQRYLLSDIYQTPVKEKHVCT